MEHVNCPLYEKAQSIPHQLALISKQRNWTYQELDLQIQAMCNFLENAGIKEHQRIAFVAHASVATIVLFFALFRLRAIACPLSTRLPQTVLSDYIQALNASHVLEPSLLSRDMVRSKPQHSTIYLNDLATFLFTSGSSGIPKIACHRFSNHYLNAISVVDRLQLEIGSRWLLSLPLFHVSGIGILFRCFLKGATIVLSDLPFSESIIQHKISHLSLVPTQLSRLLKESLETLEKMKSSLKCILLGGAPIPLATLMEGNDQQLPIYTTYGMTEMTSMITLSEKNPIGHSGQLLSNRELKLEKAEIWVKGETLFQGYWDPDTEKIILPEQSGWFATKDLGQFNQDGNLEITGRKDRQFISGGENIQPEEIEQALCTIPGIRQACVLSINDAEFGERPIAFIDDETRTHTLETIRQALRDRLPSFKHPVHILPYPAEAGIKPTLAILQQHLSQFQKSSLKNQG